MSKPELSIIVPMHGEDLAFLEATIESVKQTVDVTYEIICVDDCSSPPIKIDGVKMLRHDTHKGVGQAFDTGVAEAKSDNLFLMGSDIRFLPNNWASESIAEADKHPKAITCTTCIGINKDDMDIESRRNRSRRNGARILMFHDHKAHPKKPTNFRNILECQWLSVYKGESKASFEVPSVLGAAYVMKKEWYEYIDGWKLHRSWGTLEPMISLKSWLFGGSCRTAPSIDTAHIFKSHGTHRTQNHHLVYNKMLVATLLFDEHNSQRLIQFLGENPQVAAGKRMFEEVEDEVMKKKLEYKEKIVVDVSEWCKAWNLDFREEVVSL